MYYNHLYNLQFKGLNQVGTNFYYIVKFEKQEATEDFPDVIELIPAQNSPFVLNYKASKDNIFAPIRSSYADIQCFIPVNSIAQPSDFFFDTNEYTWKVSFYETDGATETLKWVGFLLPDVIQYEWQEQYFLQLTATDNLAVLKNVKYYREDYYGLYNDTNVDTGITLSNFICRLLKKTGSDLNVAFFTQFKINGNLINSVNLILSEYSAVDWATFEPKDCYFLLTHLMESLGCVLYQSNKDATWYVIGVNDVAVNNLVKDGSFSINGTVPYIYEYWNTSGTVTNSLTGGLNGSQCPKIFGDNSSNINQSLSFNAAQYTVSFWAKNFGGTTPRAVARVIINGVQVYSVTTTNDWVYYEFNYTASAGTYNINFFNDNDDSIGYLLLDNVSVKQKFQNGLLYDSNGTYIIGYSFNFYSSIGNSGIVKWSDVNQLVSLNKRLTSVKFNYPYYERNLINNYGFFKDYANSTVDPDNWTSFGSLGTNFAFSNQTGQNRPFDNRILAVTENQTYNGGAMPTFNQGLYNVFRISNDATFINYFAVKIECSVYFDGSHEPGDSVFLGFAKSLEGIPNPGGTSGIRYLSSNGNFRNLIQSSLWNGTDKIAIKMTDEDNWAKFKLLSTYDKNSLDTGYVMNNWGTLILRTQWSSNIATVHTTYFDDIKVSIIPQNYQNTKGFIYNATNIVSYDDFNLPKPFSNTYELSGQYHGGIRNKYESQVIEDFIGYDTGGEYNLIQNSTKWLRNWETAGELNPQRPMQECITRSILSFYQATWQKFTGNVYGKNINFGQVFNIALAQGLHFMHEASFDYVSNKTNITTHQSQTNQLEVNFTTWSTTDDDMNAGQGTPGSTTSNSQEGENE
jgi:hypothetical protein